MLDFFDGRIFSGDDMACNKPSPDVYLAAAAALGVAPQRCAVVEDSVTGVTAGAGAGATVFAFSPPSQAGYGHADPKALRAAGAVVVFEDMAQLPQTLVAFQAATGGAG